MTMPMSQDLLNDDGNENGNFVVESIHLKSTFGKKLRTIGSRLTIAEPKLKKNVQNFIHKSKSLTDSAFHKLGKVHSSKNSIPNQKNQLDDMSHSKEQIADFIPDIRVGSTSFFIAGNNDSASAESSVVGVTNFRRTMSGRESSELIDETNLRRIRKR